MKKPTKNLTTFQCVNESREVKFLVDANRGEFFMCDLYCKRLCTMDSKWSEMISKAIIDKEYIFKVIYVAAVSDIDNTNSIKYL